MNSSVMAHMCSKWLTLIPKGWLCSLEAMMQATLKDVLRACKLDLKKYLTKRDKWIGNWPGQVTCVRGTRCRLCMYPPHLLRC